MSSLLNSRFERLQQLFLQAFTPDHLEIIDESHMHAGPNLETHFKVVIVASAFDGLSRVKRHQAVYQLIEAEMQAGLHAMALYLYTAEEWKSQQQAPSSPQCRG